MVDHGGAKETNKAYHIIRETTTNRGLEIQPYIAVPDIAIEFTG
jgi:hypothetical protein